MYVVDDLVRSVVLKTAFNFIFAVVGLRFLFWSRYMLLSCRKINQSNDRRAIVSGSWCTGSIHIQRILHHLRVNLGHLAELRLPAFKDYSL